MEANEREPWTGGRDRVSGPQDHSRKAMKLVDKLKAAGISPERAEAVIRVIAEAQDELVTRTRVSAYPHRFDHAQVDHGERYWPECFP